MIAALAILLAAVTTTDCGTFVRLPQFVPTTVAPKWIPYGTYSNGVGKAEYTRVTSNLTACVMSTVDGLVERALARPGIMFDEKMNTVDDDVEPEFYTNGVPVYALSSINAERPVHQIPLRRWNDLFSLQSSYLSALYANDWFSSDVFQIEESQERFVVPHYAAFSDTTRIVDLLIDQTEPILCRFAGGHGGIAADYSCKWLRAHTDYQEPPLPSGTWLSIQPDVTNTYPFVVADLDRWIGVYPTFSALEYDTVFWPTNQFGTNDLSSLQYPREHLFDASPLSGHGEHTRRAFMDPAIDSIWGGDINALRHELLTNLVHRPVPLRLEDVISADTGLKYHVTPEAVCWTVGDNRLDEISPGSMIFRNLDGKIGDHEHLTMSVLIVETSPGIWVMSFVAQDPITDRFYYRGQVAGPVDDPSVFDSVSFSAVVDGVTVHAHRTVITTDEDYAHWRNGTRRLDWKRLGIICQLERQMERTYTVATNDIALQGIHTSGFGERQFHASETNAVDLSLPEPIDLAGLAFTNVIGSSVIVTTNFWGPSFATARSGKISVNGEVEASARLEYVFLQKDILEAAIATAIADNGLTDALVGKGVTLSLQVEELYGGPFYTSGLGAPPTGISIASQTLYSEIGNFQLISPVEVYRFVLDAKRYSPAEISASVNVQRHADASWTTSDRRYIREHLDWDNLVWANTNLWDYGYIRQSGYRQLWFMLGAKGDTASAEDWEGSVPLDWDRVARQDQLGRWYQCSNADGTRPVSGNALSHSSLESMRISALTTLNDEVLLRYSNEGPGDITSFAEVSVRNTTGQDVDRVIDAQRTKRIRFYHRGEQREAQEILASGQCSRDPVTGGPSVSVDSMVVYHYWGGNPTAVDPISEGGLVGFLLGELGVTIDYEASDGSISQPTNPKPTRFDAHTDTIVWTDWNFKNLKESTQP